MSFRITSHLERSAEANAMTNARRRTVSSADRQRRHHRRLANGRVVVVVECAIVRFEGKADMAIALRNVHV